jgi:ferritin
MKKIQKFILFNESIENDARLTDKIIDILNEQITIELESSQIYRGMACWLDDKGWIGASKYYILSSQEELTHMDKIYQYLFDRNCLAEVPTCDKVKQEFRDIREVVELSLEHEIKITANWNNISELAKKEEDNTTYEFAQWFLVEQQEDEDKFRSILFKMNLDMPKYEIDELFEDLIK